MLASLVSLLPLLALVPGADAAAGALSDADRELRNAQLRIAQQQLVASPISLLDDHNQYAPYPVQCPADVQWVRNATGLSEGEKGYLEKRGPQIDDAVARMLATVGLPKPSRRPVIGMALSGGGYRAMV